MFIPQKLKAESNPMKYHEWLIARIEGTLEKGRPIPTDLFSEALVAGLDVSEIELNWKKENK